MAGFNSSPSANNGSSRPSLRVDTTLATTAQFGLNTPSSSPLPPYTSPVSSTRTTRRVLSHEEVGDIWNSHVDFLVSLMNRVPESRWVGGSPVVQQTGECYDVPTNDVLRRLMGDNVAHTAYETPDQSFSEGAMDLDEIIGLYEFGQGSPTDANAGPSRLYMAMDGAMDAESPAQTQPQRAASNPQPTATAATPTGTWIQPYGLPANAPAPDPKASDYQKNALANSGVSRFTNYPLSTSPRMSTEEVHRNLNARHGSSLPNDKATSTYTYMESGDPIGGKAKIDTIDPSVNFQPFSWDSSFQPRTAARKAEGPDTPISPFS